MSIDVNKLTTKYKASTITYSIEKVSVIKETNEFITLTATNESGKLYVYKTIKISEYTRYFNTFKEAKDYLLNSISEELVNVIRKQRLLLKELMLVQNIKQNITEK